ncbi:MAG TPA: DnaJ domain-containing protein [Nocardioidaceae bacterium]|nr:DnaJ domain-containing protein [Nocardioidaceae bacterium]
MNPTLYDILGVSPEASQEEVRAAWRDAADRFEPGSGGSSAQFRLFNQAAEVLLDAERRKEYDAELAAEAERVAVSEQAAAPSASEPTLAPSASEPTLAPSAPDQGASTGPRPSRLPRLPRKAKQPREAKAKAAPVSRADQRSGRGLGHGLPVWVLFVLGLLAGALLGTVIYLGSAYAKTTAYQDALDEAPQAAERAAAAILSYDYERLDADRDAAAKFLTPGYRDSYVDTFDRLVKEPAVQTEARVEADVLANSTMVDTTESRDPDEVRVLMFVDQTTLSTANSGEPRTALNRARFDMVNVDGTWLVDGITSY